MRKLILFTAVLSVICAATSFSAPVTVTNTATFAEAGNGSTGISGTTFSAFDLMGGNTVVAIVSLESNVGVGTVTYGGANADGVVTTNNGVQRAYVYYWIGVASGSDLVVTPDAGTGLWDMFAVSALALSNVESVFGTATGTETSGTGTELYYSAGGGIAAAAFIDNSWGGAAAPTISGTSEYLDTIVYAFGGGSGDISTATAGFLHAYGETLADASAFDQIIQSSNGSSREAAALAEFVGSLPSNPSPYDGESGVALDVMLGWDGVEDPANAGQLDPLVKKHYVWMDTDTADSDPNLYLVQTIDISDWSSRADSYGPLSLNYDKNVSWQIEEGLDNGLFGVYGPGDPNNLKGPVWSFSTIASLPILTPDQPVSVRVFPADGAVFTVDFTSLTTPSVTWYKDDNTTVADLGGGALTDNGGGSYTTTLDLGTPVDASDEGQYYCTVTNDGGSKDSAVADLVVMRQLANFAFNGDLTDSSGNVAPTGIAMDSLGDPNTLLHVPGTVSYVDGADGTVGGALYLDPNEYVDMDPNGYPKANPVTSNGFGGGLDEGTIIVWIKPTYSGSQTILSGLNDGATDAFQSQLQSDGDHRFFIRDENGNNHEDDGRPDRPEYDPNDGNWHMMAACWSGNSTTIYVDGQWTSNLTTGSAPVSFGPWKYSVLLGSSRQSSARYLLTDTFDGGAIDNLRIYNYRLDAAGADVFAQEYYDDAGILPCINIAFAGSDYDVDNTGSSYCKIDLADLSIFFEKWLTTGLYSGL